MLNYKINKFYNKHYHNISIDYNYTNINLNNYKLLIYCNRLSLKQKIKILVVPFNKNFNKNFYIFQLLNQIRFLWRSKFLLNLFIIYYYLITNKNLNYNATILLNYLTIQFRVIFSKFEQKLLLYLLLNFNKLFINLNNNLNRNNLNNLILLQVIITGRWQRKRWVTPFPKLYISSPFQYNKLYKKINKQHYILSYKQSSIWTKKGNIGIRIFLLYNRK